MTIRHLKIFYAVCRCGSITEAAGDLYISQPAVSLAIKELEEHYGTKLFDRLSRGVRLTEAGGRLLEYAMSITKLFEDMELAIADPDSAGELKIGSSLTIGACRLPGYIECLKEKRHGLQARVLIDNTESIINAVAQGNLDVGLVEGIVNNDTLNVITFASDRLLAVCCADHPFSRRKTVSTEEFLEQPLLMRESGSGVRELFESALSLLGKSKRPMWESASTTALIRAVQSGLGVSMLPEELVAEAIRAGNLCVIPLAAPAIDRSFYLIYHKKKYLSNSIRSFIEIVVK